MRLAIFVLIAKFETLDCGMLRIFFHFYDCKSIWGGGGRLSALAVGPNIEV